MSSPGPVHFLLIDSSLLLQLCSKAFFSHWQLLYSSNFEFVYSERNAATKFNVSDELEHNSRDHSHGYDCLAGAFDTNETISTHDANLLEPLDRDNEHAQMKEKVVLKGEIWILKCELYWGRTIILTLVKVFNPRRGQNSVFFIRSR